MEPAPAPRALDDVDMTPALSPGKARELKRLLAEKFRRSIEGLRLYEPMPEQERFHQSKAAERLLRGSNRSGKTLGACVEVARAVTRQDPNGKWPEKGVFFLVGKDERHLGDVLYTKLFRPGPYRIIRDAANGKWRAYKPWLAEDACRERDTKPALPLIPRRFIQEIAWEDKKASVPKIVRLTTGWELYFYTAKGEPPQGSICDGALFDEEIPHRSWYPEISARLLDRRGRFLWSATPQAGTEQMYELHERCEGQAGKENPSAEEFHLLLDDNRYQEADKIQAFKEKIESLEEHRVRVLGEFAFTSFKIYPNFSMLLHGVDWFEIPADWTRYAAVDPGHQVCAVLFAALPPPDHPEFGGRIVLYDELYLTQCDADTFGEAMARKCLNQDLEAILIDYHFGQHTETGSGISIEQQYARALKKNKVSARRTGSGFAWASDDVAAGIEAVRGWLRPRDGVPTLAVRRNSLPNFEREMMRYHYLRSGGELTSKPAKRNDHLCDCCRYLAMYRPRYRKPEKRGTRPSGVYAAFLQMQKERRRREGGQPLVHLGPARSGGARSF